jgi:hypothetical protein
MLKPIFARRRPAPVPPPPPSVEAELLEAAAQCDVHTLALSEALARRRRALIKATAATSIHGSSHLMRCFSPSMVWAAFAYHGAGEAAGLPHVLAAHKRSFEASARAALDASAAHRTPSTAPADPGNREKEAAHAAVD